MSVVRPMLISLLLPLAVQAHAGRPKLKKLDVASVSAEAPLGVCAGTETQLTGVATLSDGTVLRSRTAEGERGDLRPADLKLEAEPKVDAHDRVFVENTGRELVGATLAVTVTGRGTDLTGTSQLPLHFRCEVPLDYTAEGTAGAPWTPPRADTRDDSKIGLEDVFLPAAMVALAARDVSEARPLLSGEPGVPGEAGTGGQGSNGGTGQQGPSGHDLVVELSDLDGLVLARIQDLADGTVREAVVDPNGGSLHLVTRGGRGGKGGRGGNGGEGAPGVDKGGVGGAGGVGGDGGPGGRGGHVTVRVPATQPAWRELVTVDAAGGPGGEGGRGGDGAWGGAAEIRGDMGADGAGGHRGPDGAEGTVQLETY